MTNPIIEAAAKICEDYANANMEICGDNILMDPLLSGKECTEVNINISRDCSIMSTIHSAQYHAGNHMAENIRAMEVPSPCRREIMPGLDHIANFINALDTSDMSAKDVRTAIYAECLAPNFPESPPS